jgi:Xaa-Pro aminopeptidase
MTKDFFINNRRKYCNQIQKYSLSLFFSGKAYQKSADEDYVFEVNKNFYYLTGINQANVILGIIHNGETASTVLFIEENDPVLVKWVGAKLTIDEATLISGIKDVRYLNEFDNFIYNSFNSSRKSIYNFDLLYLDLERRNEEKFTSLAISFSKKFKKAYPEITINNSHNKVIALRMVKSNDEIELIKESIETTKNGILELLKHSKAGLYEYQLESYFDQYIMFNGQKTHAFKTIAATGFNATILHYVNNNTILKDNELILFDLGSRTNFYVSDISRTIPVNGKFTIRQKEVYNEVLNVNKLCIEFLKPGVTWIEFNNYAKELLTEALNRLGLLKNGKTINDYYWHSIGHNIGLDTHDPGLYDKPIGAGMVLTVEPGIYIEDEAIGVRIEDNILITENGNVNLSSEIIKEVEDIENFMKK